MAARAWICLGLLAVAPSGCMLIGYDAAQGEQGLPDASRTEGGAGKEDAAGEEAGAAGGAGTLDSGGGPEDAGPDAAGTRDAADSDIWESDCPAGSSFCDRDRWVTCSLDGKVESVLQCGELGAGHERECLIGVCVQGRGCELGQAPDNMLCDDGLFCTLGEHCARGECVGGLENLCWIVSGACREGVCNEDYDRCETEPANQGEPCGRNAECNARGVCVGGGDLCGQADCAISCDLSASPCRLNCGQSESCNATCAAGNDCQVNCSETAVGCRVTCAIGSVCDVDCRKSAECSNVKCELGARCILRCAGRSDSCEFAQCPGGTPQWCPESSSWVCSRDCP